MKFKRKLKINAPIEDILYKYYNNQRNPALIYTEKPLFIMQNFIYKITKLEAYKLLLSNKAKLYFYDTEHDKNKYIVPYLCVGEKIQNLKKFSASGGNDSKGIILPQNSINAKLIQDDLIKLIKNNCMNQIKTLHDYSIENFALEYINFKEIFFYLLIDCFIYLEKELLFFYDSKPFDFNIDFIVKLIGDFTKAGIFYLKERNR